MDVLIKTVKLRKVGNSYVISIPNLWVKMLNLESGDEINLFMPEENKDLILRRKSDVDGD